MARTHSHVCVLKRRSQMAMSFCLSINLSVRLFVCLSLVKCVKSFVRWQHLATSGEFSYQLRYTCFKSVYTIRRKTACYIYFKRDTLLIFLNAVWRDGQSSYWLMSCTVVQT